MQHLFWSSPPLIADLLPLVNESTCSRERQSQPLAQTTDVELPIPMSELSVPEPVPSMNCLFHVKGTWHIHQRKFLKEVSCETWLNVLLIHVPSGEQVTDTPNSYLKRGPVQNSGQYISQVKMHFMVAHHSGSSLIFPQTHWLNF